MSKLSTDIGRLLSLIFSDIRDEVPLEEITNVKLHKGIRVDFYLPSIHCIVEIHGIQHFKASGFGRNQVDAINALSRQMDRDSKLVTICKKFNIGYEQFDYNEKIDFISVCNRFEKYKTIENEYA